MEDEIFKVGDHVEWQQYEEPSGKRSGVIFEVGDDYVRVKVDWRMFRQKVKKNKLRRIS